MTIHLCRQNPCPICLGSWTFWQPSPMAVDHPDPITTIELPGRIVWQATNVDAADYDGDE